MITVDDVATLIFERLNEDATLIGVTYLNGANKVMLTPNRPPTLANPTLAIRLIPDAIEGEQEYEWRWALWLNLYLTNLADITPDSERAGRIERRIDQLLAHVELSGTNVNRLRIKRDFPGRMIPLEANSGELPNETMWNFQYEVIAA